MKYNIITLITIFIFSCAHQETNSTLSKIEKYDDMANFLMLVTDGELKKIGSCGLDANEAMIKLNIVHQKLDEEKNNNTFSIEKRSSSNCEKKCHCGLYSDLSTNPKEKENLYKKASKIEKRDLIKCAKEIKKWICKDPEFLNLKE